MVGSCLDPFALNELSPADTVIREPLCNFLNVPIPDIPFPDGNKGAGQFQMNMANAIDDLINNALQRLGTFAVAIFVAAVAIIFTLCIRGPGSTVPSLVQTIPNH